MMQQTCDNLLQAHGHVVPSNQPQLTLPKASYCDCYNVESGLTIGNVFRLGMDKLIMPFRDDDVNSG